MTFQNDVNVSVEHSHLTYVRKTQENAKMLCCFNMEDFPENTSDSKAFDCMDDARTLLAFNVCIPPRVASRHDR